METKNAWEKYTASDLEQLEALAEDYRRFISQNKTEREFAVAAMDRARAAGYQDLERLYEDGTALKPGDKVMACKDGKAVILAHIGTEPLRNGFNILGAHIDSPRLDLKQNPLVERNGLLHLDTHYYGGIKNYQWVTLPLALHGVIAKEDGTVVQVNLGEDPDDPVFCVSDLLIHLAREQMEKTGSKVVEGEDLDVLIGSRPWKLPENDDRPDSQKTPLEKLAAKEPVKAYALQLLSEKYGIVEEDLLSAEIEVVPAGAARDLGFDRSMILGYGHDDSSCAFPSLLAQLALEDTPQRTALTVLVDKEEIGSVGATGMGSLFFENVVAVIMALAGEEGDLNLRHALEYSQMLSSDVSAAFDPAYASVFEPNNAAYLGHGLVFNKYTGSRGKSGSNDSSAEFVAHIRRIMNQADVAFQTAELGKVDAGGGGTIAYIPAKYGMDVIDSGVAVLSMHAPWEVVSKADLYEAFKGYVAFLKADCL